MWSMVSLKLLDFTLYWVAPKNADKFFNVVGTSQPAIIA